MPRYFSLSSFDPATGEDGERISVELDGGLPDILPNSLMPIGAMLRGEPGLFTNSYIGAEDSEKYTRFFFHVPSQCPSGEYNLSLEFVDQNGEHVILKGQNFFTVKVNPLHANTHLSIIFPEAIGLEDIDDTLFTIKGRNLDNLDFDQGLQLMSGGYRCTMVIQTKDTVKMRVRNKPESGRTYTVMGFCSDAAEACTSTAQLKIQ